MFLVNLESLQSEVLAEAAKDFRYLLNRGYPRKASLELVGNRYQLLSDHRHLLHRGIFSDADSQSRLKKIVSLKDIQDQNLAIDGYNVIITIEAALSGRPLVLGDDGFVRDISGLSGNFKKAEKTEEAIELVFNLLKKVKPLPDSLSFRFSHQQEWGTGAGGQGPNAKREPSGGR